MLRLNWTIPNILTLIRVLIIPIIIVTFYFDDVVMAHKISSGFFLFASITDFADGYIARRYKMQTDFGRMLDPIADKVLVATVMLMLVKFRKVQELPCILILTREFVVSGMREFLASHDRIIIVSKIAKWKTAVQMTAIFLLLLGSKGSGVDYVDFIGQIVLWCASLMTLYTGYIYCRGIFIGKSDERSGSEQE